MRKRVYFAISRLGAGSRVVHLLHRHNREFRLWWGELDYKRSRS